MTRWTQPRRESRHHIHHSLRYTWNPSCLCLLYPSACSPSEYAPSHHTANIPYPSTWMYLSDLDFNLSFFFYLYSQTFLSDRYSGHSLIPQPTSKTSCALLRYEVHPSYHQTSKFLTHKNSSLPSRDYLRPLTDWTTEPTL